MAYNTKFNPNGQSTLDASLGLIYRMNNLWARVDTPAENGDYDAWNIVLDRIFCNLSYRDDPTVIKDPTTGAITDVQINDECEKIYKFLTAQIHKRKIDYLKAPPGKIKEKTIAKSRWYHALRIKDIWLRKHMQKLGLYLRETKQDPAGALFGANK